MPLRVGGWKEALVDISVDDDLSNQVDLGREFKYVLVLIPTITSSTITVHLTKDSSTFFPLYALNETAAGDFISATTATTTSHAVIFTIGAARFIKIACGSGQAADITFYVRGFN